MVNEWWMELKDVLLCGLWCCTNFSLKHDENLPIIMFCDWKFMLNRCRTLNEDLSRILTKLKLLQITWISIMFIHEILMLTRIDFTEIFHQSWLKTSVSVTENDIWTSVSTLVVYYPKKTRITCLIWIKSRPFHSNTARILQIHANIGSNFIHLFNWYSYWSLEHKFHFVLRVRESSVLWLRL